MPGFLNPKPAPSAWPLLKACASILQIYDDLWEEVHRMGELQEEVRRRGAPPDYVRRMGELQDDLHQNMKLGEEMVQTAQQNQQRMESLLERMQRDAEEKSSEEWEINRLLQQIIEGQQQQKSLPQMITDVVKRLFG